MESRCASQAGASAMTAPSAAGPGRSHAGFATASAETNSGIISEIGGDRHDVAREA